MKYFTLTFSLRELVLALLLLSLGGAFAYQSYKLSSFMDETHSWERRLLLALSGPQ